MSDPTNPLAMFSLAGKRALLTGSSRGIGYALARGLAGAGAEVILNARSTDQLEAAAATLRAEGRTVHTKSFDVTSVPETDKAVAEIEAEIGPIDILFNNAGVNLRGLLHEVELESWHTVIATNLDSLFIVSRAVAKGMIARERGKIVNTCSVMTQLGRATTGPYTASKGGVGMLTKAMCADWARHNIQINGIAPGYFQTELTKPLVDDPEFTAWLCARTPAGRWGDVEELVGAAIYLSSDAGNFVNGHILFVDGGMTSVV